MDVEVQEIIDLDSGQSRTGFLKGTIHPNGINGLQVEAVQTNTTTLHNQVTSWLILCISHPCLLDLFTH